MNAPRQAMSSKYYTDPTYYALEREQIFYRSWQFVCHQTDLLNPGQYRTQRILDENIVIVRGGDNILRAFYNVCRHRGHRLTAGEGECKLLRCPYHAWAFDLKGNLRAAPGTQDVEGFDKSQIALAPVRLEVFCGFVFVNLDADATPMSELYPGLREEIVSLKPTIEDIVLACDDKIPHESNWKVSVENFSECYHCPVAHKYVVNNVYSGTEYRISVENGVIKHFTPTVNDVEVHGDLHIWFLWPNVAIQLFPLYKAVTVRHFESLGIRESSYTYTWYVDRDLPREHLDEITHYSRDVYHRYNGLEDKNIVKNVQLGIESRSYDSGPLIITRSPAAESELAIAYFQDRYLSEIGERTE